MTPSRLELAIAAAALLVLPFAMLALGLTVTSATEVVIYAIACMGLNILVGHTGLVSFGHGAWFGLGAYAAGLRNAISSRVTRCCPSLPASRWSRSPPPGSARSSCAGAACIFRF